MTAHRQISRALVTGGAGFIGSHTVEVLVRRGTHVTVADNLSTGFADNLSAVSGDIEFVQLDLARDEISGLLKEGRFDTIIHAAANAYIPTSIEDPVQDLEDNILATHKLLVAIRETGSACCLVNISSAAVYGEGSGKPITEDEPTYPVSPYGISKLAAELYVTLYARMYGLSTSSLRLFPVFGPRLRKQVVWDFMNRLSDNPSQLVIQGDGTEERGLNHVANVVEAILLVAERGTMTGEVYNAAAKESIPIDQVARILSATMGLSPVMDHTGKSRVGHARSWKADITRLEALGYRPSVGFEEGLADTVAWFRTISPSAPRP